MPGMDPVKVLLVGAAADQRELEHLFWCDGRHVSCASAAGAIVAVRTESPDVAIYLQGSPETLSQAFPELPILVAPSAGEAIEWVRSRFPPLSELVLSDRTVDLVKRKIGGKRLTRLEVSLLRFFAANPERMISIEELLRKVWGYRSGVQSRAVTTAVYRLRKKIELDPRNSRHLLAAYGRGYSFVPFSTEARTLAGNLGPAKVTVGRASETREVLAALAQHRFVGLVGAPGIGKSHLAQDVARSSGLESAWLVPLSGLHSTNEVVDAVCRALEIAHKGGDNAALPHALAARGRLMLVLDACEDGVEAIASVVAEWITRAPDLRVLATSRIELGDAAVRLAPLPPTDGYELFLAAARRHQPEFASEAADEETVRELIDSLEGVPLALELAAARAAVLGPKDLLSAASNPLGSGGQALRDSITRSWNLLDLPAQKCIVGCSVFAGEFDLAAFQSVVDGSLDCLTRVVSLSLLRVRNEAGSARYSLFDSIRQFASEHLEGQDRHALEVSHAEHFAGTADVRNCMAAWHRFAEHDPVTAYGATVGLLHHFRHSGPLEMLEQLVQSVPVDLPVDLWVKFRSYRGHLRTRTHDPESGLADYRAALARAEEAPWMLCQVLLHYADGLLFVGRPREALRELERAESLKSGDQQLRHVTAKILGNACWNLGDMAAAESHYERAVSLARKAGDARAERASMIALANFWPPEVSADYLTQLIDGGLEASSEAYVRNMLAHIRLSQDRTEEALAHMEHARDFFARIGAVADVALSCANIGAIRAELGQASQAEIAVREAIAAAKYGGQTQTIGLAQMTLGMLCLADGRIDESEKLLLSSRQNLIDLQDQTSWSNAGNIAILRLVQGDYREAIDTLSTVRLRPFPAPVPQQFAAYEAMGHALLGDLDTATTLLDEASKGLESHRTGLEFVSLCKHFVETLRGGAPPAPTLEGPFGSDARIVIRLTEMLGEEGAMERVPGANPQQRAARGRAAAPRRLPAGESGGD